MQLQQTDTPLYMPLLWGCVMFIGQEADIETYKNDNWRRYDIEHKHGDDDVKVWAYAPKNENAVNSHSHLWIKTDFLKCEFTRSGMTEDFALKKTSVKLPGRDKFEVLDGEGPWQTYCENVCKAVLDAMQEKDLWDGNMYLTQEAALRGAVTRYFEKVHGIVQRGRPTPDETAEADAEEKVHAVFEELMESSGISS